MRYTEIGYLSTNFNLKKLIDVLNLLKDGVHNLPPRSNFGIKFIAGATNIKYLDINFTKCAFISYEDYKKIHKYYEIKTNDVLLTIVGTIGNVAIVKKTDLPFSLQRSIAILRPNKKILDHKFLFYWLTSPKFKQLLYSRINPTAQPGIYLRMLGELKIPIPNMIIQNRIANIFSNLDDKIKNLQNQNRILEQMAHAIFKSWFIDFDLITEFKDSELGKIPKGWTNDVLENIANITSGKRPMFVSQNPSSETNIPIYGGGGIMGYVHNALFSNPLIMTGRVGTIGKIFRITDPCWLSDNTLVILPKHQYFFEFIFLLMNKIDYFTFNRGSSQPLITQTDLKNIKIILPDNKSLKKFHENTFAMFSLIDNNINRIHNLSKLRDTLLPKLMSGEIQI